jgi:hypothetical protein
VENSAENFSPKKGGKNGIFRGKSFEKSFFQEIPWNFPQKVIFRGKNVRKIGPWLKLKFSCCTISFVLVV